jgi:hypothetical protein
MADRVVPIKLESTGIGGSTTDEFDTPADPNQDGLTARAYYVQNDTSSDSSVGITRDASNNLVLFDGVSSSKLLTDIHASTHTASQITNVSAGNLSAANVQSALNELQGDIDVLNATSLVYADLIADVVISGLAGSTSGTLSMTMTAGVAYVIGQRVSVASTPHTYTASKDTYVDLSNTGVLTYVEVANGAGAPAVTSNSLRLFKVVSNGTAITTYTSLASRSEFRLKSGLTVTSASGSISIGSPVTVFNGLTASSTGGFYAGLGTFISVGVGYNNLANALTLDALGEADDFGITYNSAALDFYYGYFDAGSAAIATDHAWRVRAEPIDVDTSGVGDLVFYGGAGAASEIVRFGSSGGAAIQGSLSVSTSLSVTGSSTLSGGATVTGNITATGTLQGTALLDSSGTTRLNIANASHTSLIGEVTNGSTAIGVKIGNLNALSTAGSEIITFYSDSITTRKAGVSWDGFFSGSGVRGAGDTTVNRVSVGATTFNSYLGTMANGASAYGHKFGANTTLSTAGAKIAGFFANALTTEQSYIDITGGYTISGNGAFTATARSITTEADGTVVAASLGGTIAKNDSNVRTFHVAQIKPTLNAGVSNGSTALTLLNLDTTNTVATGIVTTLLKAGYGGTERFKIDSGGAIFVGGSAGTSGQVLTTGGAGALPTWTTPSGGSSNTALTFADGFGDFIVSGLLSPTSGTLSSTRTAGVAYVTGLRVSVSATAKTYTASKDTYVDLKNDGTFTYIEVANGAAAPAVTANSLRIEMVTTSATAVTTVVRCSTTVLFPEDVTFTNHTVYIPGSTSDGTRLNGIDPVLGLRVGGTLTKNDTTSKGFTAVTIAPTLNTGGSNTNTSLTVLQLNTTVTADTGVSTNLLVGTYNASQVFSLDKNGAISTSGAVTIDVGAAALILKPGASNDHVYMSFYADSGAPTTRSGYFGYGGAGTNVLTLQNEMGGNLVLGANSATVSISNNTTVSGTISATGDITGNTSDGRLKTEFRPFDSGALIDSIVPGLHGWVPEKCEAAGFFHYDKFEHFGFDARQIRKHMGEVAAPIAPFDRDDKGNSKSGENYVTWKERELIAVLWAEVRSLRERMCQVERD